MVAAPVKPSPVVAAQKALVVEAPKAPVVKAPIAAPKAPVETTTVAQV